MQSTQNLKTLTASNIARGVWMASVCVAAACQAYLVVVFFWRHLGDSRYIAETLPGFLMQPWEHHLAWWPWMTASAAWLLFRAITAIPENRKFQDKFLQENDDSTLSRVAMNKLKPYPMKVYLPASGLLAASVLLACAAWFIPHTGLALLPTVLLGAVSAATLAAVALIGIPALATMGTTGGLPTPRALAGFTTKSRFEKLPAADRQELIAQATRLGLDPASPDFMRGALAEYRRRRTEAAAQSKALSRDTPACPQATASSARAQRF